MTELLHLTGVAGGRPAGATFSADMRYRYRLFRQHIENVDPRNVMTFVMLNPSDANHERDDATVRRCIGFAKRERCGTLIVVNAFALVAHNPRRLLEADDPVGPDNDQIITEAVYSQHRSTVIAAWGATADHPSLRPRIAEVLKLLSRPGTELYAFGGLTAAGFPRHPLYLAAAAPLRNVTTHLASGLEH